MYAFFHTCGVVADALLRPLAPGACFTAEIKFLALQTGVLSLEALRVVDLATLTQDAIDVRYLPDIVAVEDDSSTGSDDLFD